MYFIELYHINFQTGTFEKKGIIENFFNLSYEKIANGVGKASFFINLRDEVITKENIKRYKSVFAIKKNSSIQFVGYLNNYQITADGTNDVVRMELVEYIGFLRDRIITKSYKDVDAGQIALDMINMTQNTTNGKLGILGGNIQATQNRDRSYENARILDKIIDLTEVVGGFDFEFSPSVDSFGNLQGLVFNVYGSRFYEVNGLNPLIFGEHFQKIEAIKKDEVYNYVIGIGAGTDTETVKYVKENVDNMLEFGRHESLLFAPDVTILETLQGKVDDFVEQRTKNKTVFRVEIHPNSDYNVDNLGLFQRIRVIAKIENTLLDIDELVDVYAIEVDIKNGVEYIKPFFKLVE